jgi:hypothetical protein
MTPIMAARIPAHTERGSVQLRPSAIPTFLRQSLQRLKRRTTGRLVIIANGKHSNLPDSILAASPLSLLMIFAKYR